MRITFVGLGWEQLGVSQLSAIAKKYGHTVDLAFSFSLFNDRDHLTIPLLANLFDDRQAVIAAIKKQKPDILAFSAISPTYQWMLGVAEEAKQIFPHIKTIFGGIHPSAVPDHVIAKPQVDIVCVGEADLSFPLLLSAMEKGGLNGQTIPNMMYKLPDGRIIRGPQEGFTQDLDSLPILDKALWEEYIPQQNAYLTMAGRGCPYRCSFCFNNFFAKIAEGKGKFTRQRSVEHMMYELRIAKTRYGPRVIRFYDDIFTINKKWLKSFCDEYKREIRTPFQCQIHVNFFDDEVGRILAEAGCEMAEFGVQSADEEYKRTSMKRCEKNDKVVDTIRILKKYRVYARAHHIVGLPGEGVESQELARKFYIDHTPNGLQCFWTNYFPSTEIVRQAVQMGLLSDADVQQINEGVDSSIFTRSNQRNSDPRMMNLLHAYQLIFMLMPYVPKFIRQRLDPVLISRLPAMVRQTIVMLTEYVGGLFTFPTNYVHYAKHYLFQIYRLCLLKLGMKAPPATRILNDRKFDLNVSRYLPNAVHDPSEEFSKSHL